MTHTAFKLLLSFRPCQEGDGPGPWASNWYAFTASTTIKRLQNELADTRIDMLFNNAGILRNESLEHMDFEQFRDQFEVNTLGPLRVTTALLKSIPENGKIGLMSSRMGSIGDNDSGGRYGYRMTKAALNAIGKSLTMDLTRMFHEFA